MGAAILGSADFRYRIVPDWGKLPEGWLFGEVAGVGVDRNNRVYAFTRGEHPVIVFDHEGNFLRSWGEGVFRNPHGIHMGPDDTVYCTDEGDHTVRKFTLDGKLLLQIGVAGTPAPHMSGNPFNRCTHTALSPEQDIYVSDGYGNARIHKYSPDGKLLFSWGEPGTGPGKFNIAHNICCDDDGWVYVADRENHRVQVFDGKGRYETQWNDMHRPCGLCMQGGRDPLFYIGELGPGKEFSNRNWPRLGPRVSIVTSEGRLLARLGDFEGPGAPSQFISPHGMAVDSEGAIYVGEVSRTNLTNKGIPIEPGRDPVCLQKLARVA
jgi:DNA-binding beta-propeller fold protein YncE